MNRTGIFLFVVFLSISGHIYAQNKGTIGFSFSTLNNNRMLRHTGVEYDNIITKGRGFISFAVDYWHPVTDWLSAETGVNYSFQSFTDTNVNPDLGASSPDNYDIHVVNIPIGFRAEFLKNGFVNTGILIDLTGEPGIGSYFGAGLKIESAVGFGMFINPYVKMHSIMPVNFNSDSKRLLEAGIKVGVSYTFDNIYSKRARK